MSCARTVTCLRCNGPSDTISTRCGKDGVVRRRRRCLHCGARWSTVEMRADDEHPSVAMVVEILERAFRLAMRGLGR